MSCSRASHTRPPSRNVASCPLARVIPRSFHGNSLPDRILLFQGPHEREADDEEDLVASIAETLIHEIGHYFGLSEDEIEAIEEQYWRGGESE